ncbi:hypothetical protein AB0D35_33595 [Streptomyces sp. NPDC048301]
MSRNADTRPAEQKIAQADRAARKHLPFDDPLGLEDVRRGFLGTAAA